MVKTSNSNKRLSTNTPVARGGKKLRLDDDNEAVVGADQVASGPDEAVVGTDQVASGPVEPLEGVPEAEHGASTPSVWSEDGHSASDDAGMVPALPQDDVVDNAAVSVDHQNAEPVGDNAVGDDNNAAADQPGADVSPTGHHPKFDGLLYIPLPDLERACGFAVKNDPGNRRFALGQIPASARWGTTPTTERYLTDENNNVLTAWLPQNRVNIAVTLPYKGDSAALHRILQHGRPKKEEVPSVLYASRFQTKQAKGEQEATVMPFRNIYDARERFRAKSSMPLLEASQLGRGDLVLVEVLINRYKTAKDKKNRKVWTLWDVGFELQSISLLYEAPAGIEEEDAVVVDNDIEDDM